MTRAMREIFLYMRIHRHRTVSGVIPIVDCFRSFPMSEIDSTNPDYQRDELEKHRSRAVFASLASIATAMAVGALAVALSVFSGDLVILAFCVAFSMMLFI